MAKLKIPTSGADSRLAFEITNHPQLTTIAFSVAGAPFGRLARQRCVEQTLATTAVEQVAHNQQ